MICLALLNHFVLIKGQLDEFEDDLKFCSTSLLLFRLFKSKFYSVDVFSWSFNSLIYKDIFKYNDLFIVTSPLILKTLSLRKTSSRLYL
jgi:hypothetical protein